MTTHQHHYFPFQLDPHYLQSDNHLNVECQMHKCMFRHEAELSEKFMHLNVNSVHPYPSLHIVAEPCQHQVTEHHAHQHLLFLMDLKPIPFS